jgi:hypothetical protein
VVELNRVESRLEVGVVMEEREAVSGGQDRGEQVGDADGAVSAGSGEFALCAECALPMLVVGRESCCGRC